MAEAVFRWQFPSGDSVGLKPPVFPVAVSERFQSGFRAVSERFQSGSGDAVRSVGETLGSGANEPSIAFWKLVKRLERKGGGHFVWVV